MTRPGFAARPCRRPAPPWSWLLILLGVAAVGGADGLSDGRLIAQGLPRVEYLGGPFLRHPRIVTVTFGSDEPALAARLAEFGTFVTRSDWWRAVTHGYCATPGVCIGEGRPGTHVQLDHVWPAQARDVDVAGLLARSVEDGRLGPLDAETLVLAYLPPGTHLSDAFVPRYCDGGPRAFHRMLRLEMAGVAYAVLPRCGSEDELTATASHEILEATTNPDPARRGFAFRAAPERLGFTAAGVEPVDPCGLVTGDRHRVREGGFLLQRAWSNRAAARGRDPCVPGPAAGPLVTLVPRTPTLRLGRVGASATVALDAASDRPAPTWSVAALEVGGAQDDASYFDVALDRSQVSAGDSARLTIRAVRLCPRQSCLVGIRSTLGGRSWTWPIAVVMR